MTDKLANFYTEKFYQSQVNRSYLSARYYASILGDIFIPTSVVDVGCGRGTWLKAFHELGASKLVGYDGVNLPILGTT